LRLLATFAQTLRCKNSGGHAAHKLPSPAQGPMHLWRFAFRAFGIAERVRPLESPLVEIAAFDTVRTPDMEVHIQVATPEPVL